MESHDRSYFEGTQHMEKDINITLFMVHLLCKQIPKIILFQVG